MPLMKAACTSPVFPSLRQALDEATEIELFTGSSQGYDSATHNLKGLEFVIKTFTDKGVENLGSYTAK